jgi:hypothetical protein
MANLGGNHDGTVSGDACADAAACDNGGLDLVQRLDDAVLPLGRNGGNDMLSPAFGVNGAHPIMARVMSLLLVVMAAWSIKSSLLLS